MAAGIILHENGLEHCQCSSYLVYGGSKLAAQHVLDPRLEQHLLFVVRSDGCKIEMAETSRLSSRTALDLCMKVASDAF
jgi:hypothetical protein